LETASRTFLCALFSSSSLLIESWVSALQFSGMID
jgi:hypothetical protein